MEVTMPPRSSEERAAGRPNPRRVTSREVAAEAGVSRTTVSLVLNNVPGTKIPDITRQRVLRAAEELGYTPNAMARALVTRRSHLLGFVLCQRADEVFSDAFLPEVIRGVSDVARPRGYRVMMEPVEDVSQPGAYVPLVREQRIDGLLLSGPRSDDQQLAELRRENFPVVLLGQLPDPGFPFVDVDNVSGARKAVEHLLKLGHRRIGLITNAPSQYTSSADRLEGYRQALHAHGLPFEANRVRFGHFTEESGYAAMADLLVHAPALEAVFVASDVVAFGALAATRAHGFRVPQDIAVVGFDDTRLARYTNPPLTTVHLPARDLGACAAEMLIRLLQGREVREQHMLLETELVIRKSCGHD
jgi:LacI family transcriptional regulator